MSTSRLRRPPGALRGRSALVVLALALLGLPGVSLFSPLSLSGAPAAAAASDPVVAAGGDIACDVGSTPTETSCDQGATSDILTGLNPDAVLPLGDEQYMNGSSTSFAQMYDPSWGRDKSVSHPVPGNHEYATSGASGYYGYFGNAAGDPSKGYYSWDIGAWHVIALNSNCGASAQIGCASGSPQETWLQSDLAANAGKCILAYWHHPLFSSGNGGSNSIYQPFWQDLYNAHADVVLNGHTHGYEVFAPQSPTGAADPMGPREFVVGTGGYSFYGFTAALPNEQVRQNSTFGVMKLVLHATSYDWQFLPVAGSTWTDSGTATCHNAAPAAPTGVTVSGTPTTSQVPLSWAPSTSSGVSGYRVYRNGASAPLNSSLITGTSFTDTTVAAGTSYTYTVTAVNSAGIESPPSAGVTVTTPTGADTTPPAVTGTSPASGATGVPTTTTVSATFSESVQPATVTTTSVTLTGPSGTVPATVTYDDPSKTATLTPSAPLTAATTYTATVTTAVQDLAGNALTAPTTWTFTTAAAASFSADFTGPDGSAPTGWTVTKSAAGTGAGATLSSNTLQETVALSTAQDTTWQYVQARADSGTADWTNGAILLSWQQNTSASYSQSLNMEITPSTGSGNAVNLPDYLRVRVQGGRLAIMTRVAGGPITTLWSGSITTSDQLHQFQLRIDTTTVQLAEGPLGATPTIRVTNLAHHLPWTSGNLILNSQNTIAATPYNGLWDNVQLTAATP